MKKLLSLPRNLVKYFHKIENKNKDEWFCTSDPVESYVGSGGGTSWLLKESFENDKGDDFNQWISNQKRIIIHAGGQSRRLPAYAPSGKILTPIPVFRWERGQKINQNLLDLQVPLYEKILQKSPKNLNTLIASGDVCIQFDGDLKQLPDVDIVCYGLWVNAELACNHGVFVCKKNNPEALLHMLQKPSVEDLKSLPENHLYLMDIGVWVLSDRAVELLVERSGYTLDENGQLIVPDILNFYDLYSDFGLNMGGTNSSKDSEINDLSIAILTIPKGEFYHFGTSKELISSTLSIQNRVMDQRSILHRDSKPHPSMFVQNADVQIKLHSEQRNLWIENSFIGNEWSLESNHIITGIPKNDWNLKLPTGICIDIIPVNEDELCIRPYGFNDKFKGLVNLSDTQWMGNAFNSWLSDRNLNFDDLEFLEDTDIQDAKIFPVIKKDDISGGLISWMISPEDNKAHEKKWLNSTRFSASDISNKASLTRLYAQRNAFCNENVVLLHENYKKSVFYQTDLDNMAKRVAKNNLVLPLNTELEDPFLQMHEYMFHARVKQYNNEDYKADEQKAFGLLRDIIVGSSVSNVPEPQLSVFQDQIVWGRSPIRIDVAGGWSDAAPYTLIHGGAVVNMAIELNGQPPLQVYIKPSKEYKIILRSIDIGSREDITTYEELAQFYQVGSAFSIPKAALFLSGFSGKEHKSLEEQLKAFGSGIEISTLAAIPKGSGLGTSSILGATVLGALSDFCGFGWSKNEICHKTMILEQLLTTGGGWQDQYGGVFPGIKLLHTQKGSFQIPEIRWAPEFIFTNPENKARMLLYYTGITRVAKDILSEIVRRMFLNESVNTNMLKEIKSHAFDTFDALQGGDFTNFNDCVGLTWEQNKALDKGTFPPKVQELVNLFKDYASAYKLPGAGGGGYMFIIAKDPEAAGKIRKLLIENPPNNQARFVDIDLSSTGFQSTRS